MRMSNNGLIFLASLEGLATQLYLDSVNVRTIGIGSTISEIADIDSKPWSWEITIKEAISLFQESLKMYESAVDKALQVAVSQSEFDALVSICYNIGTGGLTRSTFIKLINKQESRDSIYKAILMWDKPPEIIGRRTKEAILFRDSKYPVSMQVNWFPVSAKTHYPIYSNGKNINLLPYLSGSPLTSPTGDDNIKVKIPPAPPINNSTTAPNSLANKLKKILKWPFGE